MLDVRRNAKCKPARHRPKPRLSSIALLTVAMLAAAPLARGQQPADFRAEAKQVGTKVEAVWPAVDERMVAGDVPGATAKLLSAIPAEGKRSAAESFLLGNVLFEIDRKQSYALHQAAAKADPQNTDVVWEWAMELHRAGEYAAALAAYQAYSKGHAGQAAAYALQADCLLRLNKLDDAAAAWKQSEDAPNGSIEAMEELVCSVHREPMPYARRAELLAKVTAKHDADAAAELIALDCDWPYDWWNAKPDAAYLKHDIATVTAALKLPADDARLRAMACAAECGLADPSDGAAIRAALTKHRFLLDADHSFPANGGLLARLLIAAVQSGAIDAAELQKQVGPKVWAMARQGGDVRIWNSAIYFGPRDTPPDAALQQERDGWKATNDARFAAGTLFAKLDAGKLAGDDAELAAALKQFPGDGAVWRAAYAVAVRDKKVTRELLAGAAKAEFNHFSSYVAPATVVNRPRSGYLRGYMLKLRDLPAAAK